MAFEWVAQHLDKNRFELSFILLGTARPYLQQFLEEGGWQVHFIYSRGKSNWPLAILKTFRCLRKIRPQVVHCHLIQANVIGLCAAKLAGINKRIYTRHHSSLHHVYFPRAVSLDKFCNYMASDIIAISGIVKTILKDWEKVPEKKIHLIPHGFDLNEFHCVSQDRVDRFRKKYSIGLNFPVIATISRFTEWKGVQYVIPAFKELLIQYPNALLLLLNAKGDYEATLMESLNQVPENKYRLIPFEKDIAAAYKVMDVFVHVPIDEHSEAFGQTYVEALAAQVPSVFTLSGIAPDFVVDKKNALVVPFKNSKAIKEAVLEAISKKELQESMKREGWISCKDKFSLPGMMKKLEELYEKR